MTLDGINKSVYRVTFNTFGTRTKPEQGSDIESPLCGRKSGTGVQCVILLLKKPFFTLRHRI